MNNLKIRSLQHKRSSDVNDENGIKTPKLPTAEQLVDGEIAINYAKDYETLSIKNSSGDVVTFSSDSIIYNNVDNKIGTVAEGRTVVGMIDDAKTAIEGTFKDGDARTLADLNTKIETKTYSIATATTEGLGTNVREAYKLVDEDGVQVGETIIKVYNDSALQSVALVDTKPAEGEEGQDGYEPSKQGQFLMFDYLTTKGEPNVVYLDVSSFLAESEFADGLQVLDHVVSVKRDSTSEGFLTVGANGIKLSGVQDAINVEKTRAEAAEKTINDKIGTVTGTTLVDMIADAKSAAIAASTVVTKDSEFITIEQTGEVGQTQTYTIKTQDVASASATTAAIDALNDNKSQIVDVTSLFTEVNSISGYTLLDLTKNTLYHSNGNTVKFVGYGNSAINPTTNEANLVMESFKDGIRTITIAYIKQNDSTITTQRVKTYSSNAFIMKISQSDYDTMKNDGTLDANTLYVIS